MPLNSKAIAAPDTANDVPNTSPLVAKKPLFLDAPLGSHSRNATTSNTYKTRNAPQSLVNHIAQHLKDKVSSKEGCC
ncbi:hypothetical protein VNO78_10699 [Psophocarpus tetragonolobus]|uniref:Uncharacterized protein n=1 Tax=Psophocarpus tetragonolobus TaxID=3891 RepID=A0AAN9SRW0_PSOTE